MGGWPGSVLRVDLSRLVYGLLLAYLFLAPLQRGLFFEPDLFPNVMALAVLFGAHVLDRLARGETWIPARGMPEAGLAVLAVAYGLAFFPAADRRAALTGWIEVLAGAAVYVLASSGARTPARRHALLHAVWLCGVAAAGFALVAAAGVVDFPGAVAGGRLASVLQYPNALAALMIVASLAGVGLWTIHRTGVRAFVYAVGTYACQLVLLGSQSRGGWLVYPLAFVVLLALLPAAWRWWAVYAQGAALGMALLAGTRVLPALLGGQARAAAAGFLAGAAALAGMQALAASLPALLRRFRPGELTLRLLRYGAAAYVLVTALSYVAYAARVPAGMATVVPAPVLARAETIQPGAAEHRRMYARDALTLIAERPWLGAGAGGWDALYHRVQSVPYWSTEVHSHPLQVAVESGLLGLMGFALAVAGVARVPVAMRRAGEGDATVAIASAAAAGLLVHACFDFDLSFPGLAFVFWALAGALRAAALPDRATPVPAGRAVVWALAGLGLAGVMAYPSWRLHEARYWAAQASLAFRQGTLGTAREYYERALALDPWSGTYAVDLAQVHVARQLARFDPEGFAKAGSALDHALRVQPHSLPIRSHAARLYALMGRRDEALAAAAGLVWNAPLDGRGYGIYGSLLVSAALERLEAGDVPAAKRHLDRVFRLEAHWRAQVRRVARAAAWGLHPALNDPHWTLALGQAYVLAGYPERAEALLRAVGGEARAEAQPWLAAALYLTGRMREAGQVLSAGPEDGRAARDLFARILALHGFAVDPDAAR